MNVVLIYNIRCTVVEIRGKELEGEEEKERPLLSCRAKHHLISETWLINNNINGTILNAMLSVC